MVKKDRSRQLHCGSSANSGAEMNTRMFCGTNLCMHVSMDMCAHTCAGMLCSTNLLCIHIHALACIGTFPNAAEARIGITNRFTVERGPAVFRVPGVWEASVVHRVAHPPELAFVRAMQRWQRRVYVHHGGRNHGGHRVHAPRDRTCAFRVTARPLGNDRCSGAPDRLGVAGTML